MKRFIKRFHNSEQGFTLIELLVVVGILGVIAAVVALNVGSFLGTGVEQAAATELHQTRTAVLAAMSEAQSSTIAGDCAGGGCGDAAVKALTAPAGGNITVGDYMTGSPLRGTFTITTGGVVTMTAFPGLTTMPD